MAYDAFVRGVSPVGVRSDQLIDRQRANRSLPLEVWYPASSRYAGQDLDTNSQDVVTVLPAAPPLRQAAVRDAAVRDGSYPLLLFSHTGMSAEQRFAKVDGSRGEVRWRCPLSSRLAARLARTGTGRPRLTRRQAPADGRHLPILALD
jgi:predicted dienelactone hydrolase